MGNYLISPVSSMILLALFAFSLDLPFTANHIVELFLVQQLRGGNILLFFLAFTGTFIAGILTLTKLSSRNYGSGANDIRVSQQIAAVSGVLMCSLAITML